MKDDTDERVEKPALVEEMGLLEGQEIVKSPPLRSLVEGIVPRAKERSD